MGVDPQLQIYILAGVFGIISIVIIFFLAGICGQISKIKRQQRRLLLDRVEQITGYDNYAFNSRTIRPNEELSQRGFTMYESNSRDSASCAPNVHHNRQSGKSGKSAKTQDASRPHDAIDKVAGETGQDLMNEYSIANSETVVMSGNDMQMKIKRNSYPPQFVDIPPPPAFRQKAYKADTSIEPNSSNNRNEDRL